MSQVMDLDGLSICTVAPNSNTLFYLAKQSTLHSFHKMANSAAHHYSYLQFSHSPCVAVECTTVIISHFLLLHLKKVWEMLYCGQVSYLTNWLCTGHQNVVKLSKTTASD